MAGWFQNRFTFWSNSVTVVLKQCQTSSCPTPEGDLAVSGPVGQRQYDAIPEGDTWRTPRAEWLAVEFDSPYLQMLEHSAKVSR